MIRRLLPGKGTSRLTPERLRECPGCGLFQVVPPLKRDLAARCTRCGIVLRRGRMHSPADGAALTLACIVLLVIMAGATMMTVQTAGIVHEAKLLAGPEELFARGLGELGVVVAFASLIAPGLRFAGNFYVLAALHLPRPPRHLRAVFAMTRRLKPWAMIDVFLLGVFVAVVKMGDLVTISLGPAIYALGVLTIVMVWAELAVDADAVWDEVEERGLADRPIDHPALIAGPWRGLASCHQCGLVCEPADASGDARNRPRCPRCGAHLHGRKPDSLARTTALVIAAMILYVPANVYPVLTVISLGSGSPSTIFGGVRELIESQMWPLAALVFLASIAIPVLKLFALSVMLWGSRAGHAAWLRERTRIYYAVEWVGRWSMVDIFMESLLGAIVRFGGLATIEPGVGAIAFASVVILTMFAAETFDPRLMWDSAESRVPLRPLQARAINATETG